MPGYAATNDSQIRQRWHLRRLRRQHLSRLISFSLENDAAVRLHLGIEDFFDLTTTRKDINKKPGKSDNFVESYTNMYYNDDNLKWEMVLMSLSPCGINCGEFEACKSAGCGGCHSIQGKPFFLKDFGMEVCPLYDCPVNKKGFHTCAECSELPCKIYYDWKDPSMSDEEHINSIDERVKVLKGSLK